MTIEGGEQRSQRIFRRRMAIKYTLRLDDAHLLPEDRYPLRFESKSKKHFRFQEMDGLQSSREKEEKELPLCNRL